jgi:hypothetical protein
MTEANRTEDLGAEPMAPVLEKTEVSVAVDGVQTVIFYHAPGVTKREYFAAMAMQGAVANNGVNASFEGIASEAVKYADALLKELAK